MARQIPDLPILLSNEARDDDLVIIRDVSSQVDKKITIGQLRALLGGGGGGGGLTPGSVTSDYLADKAVLGSKIADGAVTSDKIKDGSVGASKIDLNTFNWANATQIGVFNMGGIYLKSFTGTMPSSVNTWGLVGNIGAYNIALAAFGCFTSGNEYHFFPGGTTNSEMSSIYYNNSTGNVYVKTTYSFPCDQPVRVTVIYR